VGAGEIEIAVLATGLNFRDVLTALDLMGADAQPLGGECVGRVTTCGAGVTGFAIGDLVMGLCFGRTGFADFVVCQADLCTHVPRELTPTEAATLPVAYLTALYGLERLAGLQRGERVLIHAAAGGVGSAAVDVALALGAEVFATVGSAEKRAMLLRRGVRWVGSSREASFAAKLRKATADRRIDVVLNALTGDFIPASLDSMSHNGRFVEIGRRDAWSPEQIAARRPDVRTFAFDLVSLAAEKPALVSEMLAEVARRADNEMLRPLPYRAFSASRAADAFRLMARGNHIGKLVVTRQPSPLPCSTGGSWLITGGLGGLGLKIAAVLAREGAQRIVLVGRSEPGAGVLAEIDRIARHGAKILVRHADIGVPEDVHALIADLDAAGEPLCGVVHAAAHLADALLSRFDWPAAQEVLRAKALGAWSLHEALGPRRLAAFVMFSSVVTQIGSSGQAAYAAANAILDALARHRRSLGLAATSVAWGPWSGVGMAARVGQAHRERMGRAGVGLLSPEQGVATFLQILRRPEACLAVLPPVAGVPTGQRVPAASSLKSGSSRKPRPGELREHVVRQLAAVLGRSGEDQLDTRRPFKDLGVDSLMAVELRNSLSRLIDRPLAATLLFDYPEVDSLVIHLETRLAIDVAGDTAPRAAKPLDDADLERLLDDRVKAILGAEITQTVERSSAQDDRAG
jgi:NADPH:quinone reductase-like Zn-dependent oxidoreductase/acyl carrier protein